MKKIAILVCIVSLLALVFAGCSVINSPTSHVATGYISIGGAPAKGSRSLAIESTNGHITEIWIRAFNEEGVLIPATNSSSTEGAAVLTTWNATESHWEGNISLHLEGYTGNLYFHAMAYYGEEIAFNGTFGPTLEFGKSTIDIKSTDHYTVGDRGPGGGWIFYDKGSFTIDSKMGGKSWRYLEAAAEDFSLAWLDAIEDSNPLDDIDDSDPRDSAKIDSDHKIHGGKVKLIDVAEPDDENLFVELSEYDWYWGAAGALSTDTPAETGWLNTDIIDGLAAATPAIGRKAKGRKDSGDSTNTRRDTGKELRSKTINNYDDWFVPSKKEMEYMLANIVNGGTRSDWNFSETKYWSSSEYDGANLSGETYPQDIYWAWAIDFTDGEETNVLMERSEALHVRPARAF